MLEIPKTLRDVVNYLLQMDLDTRVDQFQMNYIMVEKALVMELTLDMSNNTIQGPHQAGNRKELGR